jgi:hypothetical protein
MNADHVSLLLAVLGGSFLFASLVGRRAEDAPRDVWLMLATACSRPPSACTPCADGSRRGGGSSGTLA